MSTKTILHRSACLSAALFCAALVGGAAQAAIPVTTCSQTLNVPGGQYVLTGNLTCPTAPGAQIAANGITFDLQGFTLSGPGSGAGLITASGSMCAAVTDVIIRGGTIAGFETGIALCAPYVAGGTAMRARISGMTLTQNVDGMRVMNSNLNNVLESNISRNRGVGVMLANAHDNTFIANTIDLNASPSFSGGLLVSGSDRNMIEP